MRIKRYTAQDMTEALRQVRSELGGEAVILSTSRTPEGLVEVSAAVDPPAAASSPGAAAPLGDELSLAALARRVEGLGQMVSRHLVLTEAAAGFPGRPQVAPLYHHLCEQEVDPQVISHLLEDLGAGNGLGLLPRFSIRLKKMIQIAQPLDLTPGTPRVWALVGPTGVGKTTTLAKLAAHFGLRQGVRVALVSVDTYRMAAAEQLKVYAGIMGVPFFTAGGSAELEQVLARLEGVDLVLVDTEGRAPGDGDSLAELRATLGELPGLACHLLLAAPTRDRDQRATVEAFADFQPQSLIFTKLDETTTFGPILNQVVRTGCPVSYITSGQRVPDDLEEASRESLARRLLPPRRDLA